MSTPSDQPSGWRATPSSGQRVRRKWQADHPSGNSARVSLRMKRGLFGLLTLSCAAVIGWLLLVWIFDRIPPAQVVTFGISDYHSPHLPPNPFGEEDALAFRGLKEHSPRQFAVTDIPNKLTGGEILKTISGDLSGKNLIVFCSLHGRLVPDATSSGIEAQFFGINADGSGDMEPLGDERKMVPVPELLRQLKQTHAKNILLLIESGQLQPNWPLGILANEFVAQVRQHLKDEPSTNLSILCSAAPYQLSHTLPKVEPATAAEAPGVKPDAQTAEVESEPVNQTVFAYYVLQGLKGKADGWGAAAITDKSENASGTRFVAKQHIRNRRVDADELHAFVAQQVKDWVTREIGPDVTQTVTRLGSSNFEIAAVPGASSLQKSVVAELAKAQGDTAPKSAVKPKTPQTKTAAEKKVPGKSEPSKATASATTPSAALNPMDLKIFEAVLSAPVEDPKLAASLKDAMAGNQTQRNNQQQALARWLIEQASQEQPPQAVFNARPLLNKIDEFNRTPDLELLSRLLDAEQSTPATQVAWPSLQCREALLARKQAAQLVEQASSLPPHLIPDLHSAVQSLQAAERWLLAPATSPETGTFAKKWYARFAETRKAVLGGQTRFAMAIKLSTDLHRELPLLAHRAADRAERNDNPPPWRDLKKLGGWLDENSQSDSDAPPPLEILQLLPDLEAKELLKLMRSTAKLERLVRQPGTDAEFKQALETTESLWNQFPKQTPQPPIALNPHVAGVWQGFWAIETLRFRGAPKAELSPLWQQWLRLVAAGSEDTDDDPEIEPAMRLPRVILGSMIQQAWAKTSEKVLKPSRGDESSGKASAEISTLWKQLQNLDRGIDLRLRFSQVEGSGAEVASNSSPQSAFVIATKSEKQAPFGNAAFQIGITRSLDAPVTPLKVCFFGPDLVVLSHHNIADRCFDVDPSATTLSLSSRFPEKSMQDQSLLVALLAPSAEQGGLDFPIEIRQLRIKPPFDPSLWSVVFKTEKGQPVFQSLESSGSKLYLLPSDETTLVPYLKGPLLPDHPAIDVAVLQTTADGEKPISELKQVALDAAGEAKLLFGLAPPPAAGASAATTPPAEAPKWDVSNGLKFVIKPQGHPAVHYSVPIAFFSSAAFIKPPQPVFKGLSIQIPVQREQFDVQAKPLLQKSIFVELQLSPALANVVAQSTPKVELKPTDDKPKVLSLELAENVDDFPTKGLDISMSVAGLPHVYRWDVQPRPPRSLLPAKTPAVRIMAPSPSLAFFRKAGKLHWLLDGEEKPTEIDVQIAVDAPVIEDSSTAGLWKLFYELQDRGGQLKDSYTWNLTSSLNKTVGLSMKEGIWKLSTSASDFVYRLPAEGLKGKFALQAKLARPGASTAAQHEIDLAIDETKPSVLRFASKLPLSHPADADLKILVEAADPESDIYEIVAGLDLNQNRKLDDDAEKLTPIYDPPPRVELTIPKNRLPPMGGFLNVIVKATNRTRVQSTETVSDRIEFKPPELPKAATTGTLRVEIDKAAGGNKWKITGPTNATVEPPAGTGFYEFKNLEPGEYQIEVRGYNYQGTGKRKVEAGKTATATLQMQSR